MELLSAVFRFSRVSIYFHRVSGSLFLSLSANDRKVGANVRCASDLTIDRHSGHKPGLSRELDVT